MFLIDSHRFLDPDAELFISNVGITDGTQQTAINNLVVSLKNDNLWDGMVAIYPMVGGTATTHKYNLKDPRDLDIAFRLDFNGGWTHASTGALPNGTNGYADTHINPLDDLTNNDVGFSFYSLTDVAGGIELGAIEVAGLKMIQMRMKGASSSTPQLFDCYGNTGGRILGGSNTISNNFHIYSRRGATDAEVYIDGSSTLTSSTGNGTPPDINMYLSCRNNVGTADVFDSKECAFASIGTSFDDTDASNLHTIVTSYNTELSREN
jgi:hypothetical protein